jgi:hypothetical protein
MKNPYEVLLQKNLALREVRQQIEALRLVAPLLMEDEEPILSDVPEPKYSGE